MLTNELMSDRVLWAAASRDVEIAGEELARRVHPDAHFATLPRYWNQLKLEFRLFVCTDEPKYADIREKARNANAVFETILLTGLISAFGKTLGIEAAILAPFVKLLIVSIAKISVAAYCVSQNLIDPKTGKPLALSDT